LRKYRVLTRNLARGLWETGEDTLFAQQLRRAGYKIVPAFDVCAEHHFDVARLQKRNLIRTAQNAGKAYAYIHHHYFHFDYKLPHLRLMRSRLALALWQASHKRGSALSEGLSETEMRLWEQMTHWSHYLVERKVPRKYRREGSVKLSMDTATKS
jgi:hypothetical protein